VAEAAPDGSPVELYARLEPLGEPELIDAEAPAGAEILELGCGAGRVTHALLALGHPVVAVDNSAEMLAHVRGAETVLGDVEALELDRRFPVVLLASQFVNVPDVAQRQRLLATCARHVAPDGIVLVERLAPDWQPVEDEVDRGGVRMALRDARRDGKLVSGTMEYAFDGRVLRHPFTSYVLDDDELDAALAEARLALDSYLDERGVWVRAVPAPRGRA
jgi:SAM-dependent methyltransferase